MLDLAPKTFAIRNTGSGFGMPTHLGLLAEVRERLAHCWDAELERLERALALLHGTARRKGGRGSASARTDAESCFRSAIEIARRQETRSFELRAATSLARSWQSQGKIGEARALVAEAYEWFGEGFGTADRVCSRTSTPARAGVPDGSRRRGEAGNTRVGVLPASRSFR